MEVFTVNVPLATLETPAAFNRRLGMLKNAKTGRMLTLFLLLIALALVSTGVWEKPALARPCCYDCPGYPVPDYSNSCWQVCVGCGDGG